MIRSLPVAIFTLFTLGGCASLSEKAPAGVDLTGIWLLNAEMSDDPAMLADAARPENRGRAIGARQMPGSGPGTVGGHLPGGDPGTGMPRGGRGSGGGMHRGNPLSALSAQELDISQRDDATRIEYDGRGMTVYKWGESNRRIQTSSGWRKKDFVISREGNRGRGFERRFTVSEDGATLTIITTIGKRSITQVYDNDLETTRQVYGG